MWQAIPSSSGRNRRPSRLSSAGCRTAAFPQFPLLIPLQPAATPDVDVGDKHRGYERDHLPQAKPPELVEIDSPRVQEDDLDVEDDEQHRRQVVLDGESDAGRLPGRLDAALVGLQ